MSVKKVLIVDSDPLLRGVKQQALGHEGYQVLAAGSVTSALEQLQENPDIKLVRSELKLQGKDSGFQLIDRMLEKGFRQPVVIESPLSAVPEPLRSDHERLEAGGKIFALHLQSYPAIVRQSVADGVNMVLGIKPRSGFASMADISSRRAEKSTGPVVH